METVSFSHSTLGPYADRDITFGRETITLYKTEHNCVPVMRKVGDDALTVVLGMVDYEDSGVLSSNSKLSKVEKQYLSTHPDIVNFAVSCYNNSMPKKDVYDSFIHILPESLKKQSYYFDSLFIYFVPKGSQYNISQGERLFIYNPEDFCTA